MSNLEDAKEYTKKMFSTNWVMWAHEKTPPAQTPLEKSLNLLLGTITKHCAICLNLNRCCFVKGKCPKYPLHPSCHCDIIDIPPITAEAECSIEKFTKYIFVNKNSKKDLFELWGYSIIDSDYLQREFQRQAELSYYIGDYILGNLDPYGQRVSIKIRLKRKNTNDFVTFMSGWMIYPNGRIVLTTPYGGK